MANDFPAKDTEEAVFEAVQQEADGSKDTFTRKLSKPIDWDGKHYTELTFDWSKLTGKDDIDIENELARLNIIVFVPAATIEYMVRMAARACTVPIGIDLLGALTLKDFNAIRGAARNFLMRSA